MMKIFARSQSNKLYEKVLTHSKHKDQRRQWHPTPVLLPGKSRGRRVLVGCSPWGSEESDTTERLHFHFSLSCIGEGNGNPLQCSCLESPRDGEPGGLPSMGSAQSRTRLKWLSSSSSSSKWVWSFMGNYFHCPKLKYANMLIWGNHLSSLRFTWSKMGNMASSVDKRSFLYKTLCI